MRNALALLLALMLMFSVWAWDMPVAKAASGTISANGTYDIGAFGNGSTITINPGLTVTLTNNSGPYSNMQIVCKAGVSLTIHGLFIENSNDNYCALSFLGSDNQLILAGSSTLCSGDNVPGIKVEAGTELEILGDGSVSVYGGGGGAGIGAGTDQTCGTITISGGTVTAYGGAESAGVGGAYKGSGGIINISGGVVTAYGGTCGSGIGGAAGQSAGTINISGGSIDAKGNQDGAGIGGATGDGVIQISGGHISANSESYGAGIGGAMGSSGGSITIHGGTILANGGDLGGAGIGGGYEGDGGTILISGDNITDEYAASGYINVCGTGKEGSAGIGGGYGGSAGSITISGSYICASKGDSAPYDVGSGQDGTGGNLTLSGSSVLFLEHEACITPTTLTHTLKTTPIIQDFEAGGDKAYGFYLPAGWGTTAHVYLDESKLFDVTYNANGGAGTLPEPVTQYQGTKLAVAPGYGLVKNAVAFHRWNTENDGSGDSYMPGSKLTVTGDTVLYAIYGDAVPVSSVQLSQDTATMTVGDTLSLTATVLPEDASNPDITWSTSDDEVVTVDQNGLVTAVGLGTATITATADGKSDSCSIEVTEEESPFARGDGSESDPYGIFTPEQLNAVRDYPDAHFIMLNDIDMSEATGEDGIYWNGSAGWEMLCPSSDPFLGSFDGNDKEISGLSNLFSYIGNDTESGKTGHVFNLFVSGSLADTNRGIIEHVCTSGISGGPGGIVNWNYGLISKCVNGAYVDASHSAAGVAVTNLGTISGCYNTGGIHGESGSGGIVHMNYGTVENSFNAGYVEDRNGAGGIVGWNQHTIRNCYNIGGLDSSVVIPGAIVQNNYGSVEECFFLDTVEKGICTGTGTATNVVALSESQILEAVSYAGFDFDTIWSIDGQENYPYPQLIGNPYTIDENNDEFEGGCGLPVNPYKISSPAQLNNMRNYPGSWFELINDIDMSGPTHEGGEFYNHGDGWIPVGDYFLDFMGGLDGNGHNIKGIYINSSENYWNNGKGLFGNLGSSARVRNLGMTDSDIFGNERAGSIAGFNRGTIQNCYCSGTIIGDYAGGIVSLNSGSIINCYNIATVCGSESGGLAASNGGTIRYGYNAGAVDSLNIPNYSGAIAYQSNGTVEHCRYLDISAYGIRTDTGTSSDILPKSESDMHLESCYDSFDFVSVWTMEGEASYPYPELCTVHQLPFADNSADFEGGKGYPFSPFQIATPEQFNNIRKYSSSFFELKNDIDFSNAVQEGGEYYNDGKGWDPIGDFMGGLDANGYEIAGLMINRPDEYNVGLFSKIPAGGAYIRNLTLKEVDIRGGRGVGSIAGNSGATLTRIHAYGSVMSDIMEPEGTGGLVGENYGPITLCSNGCDVTGIYAGGIAGTNDGAINRCFNAGVITGDSRGGGIAGNAEGNLLNCFNIGEVKQSSRLIGFLGFGGIVAEISSGNIINCYNLGSVSSINESNVGGIAGIAGMFDETEIEHCYYLNMNDKGIGYLGDGTEDNTYSKNGEELKRQATFVGFDFIDAWEIIEGERFPVLQGLLFTYTNAVSLDKNTIEMNVGQTETLIATVSPADATNNTIEWSSSDENVVTVEDGIVTAASPGTATITVTTQDGGYTDSCIVTVLDTQPVTSVSISSHEETLAVNDNVTLTATVLPDNATYPTVTWSTSNENVATVNQNGQVTAVSPGTATITATADGQSDTCTVTVIHATIQSSKYTIDRGAGLLKGVADGTTVAMLRSNLNNDGSLLKVYNANGQEITGGFVGTGMTVGYSVGGVQKDSLSILVLGDTNGDGIINVSDYVLVRLDILGLRKLNDTQAVAGDVDKNGRMDVLDYTLIRLDILGDQKING